MSEPCGALAIWMEDNYFVAEKGVLKSQFLMIVRIRLVLPFCKYPERKCWFQHRGQQLGD